MRICVTSIAFVLAASLACDTTTANDSLDCSPVDGNPRPMPEAKLYFEYQSTDNDTGIHGMFDASGWSELCITFPDGSPFLITKPQGHLRDHNLGGIFFESREPKSSEMSQAEVLEQFPPGEYSVVGLAFSGESLTGSATLTHDLAAPPAIVSPADGSLVDPGNVVIEWEPVTETINGDPVTITGYEVIVTNEDKDGEDIHGMSHPLASIHVVPSVNSLGIPSEFFESGTEYELELIAIEESGNQTITVQFFSTP